MRHHLYRHIEKLDLNWFSILLTGAMLVGFAGLAWSQQNPAANAGTATPAANVGAVTTQPSRTPAVQTTPDVNDPFFDTAPLPKGTVSLIGGTVRKIDRIRNRMVVAPYGGGKSMTFYFDERSHIFRDGVETTQLGIRKGERVYVDSQLDKTRTFARTVRVETSATAADAAGQILRSDAKHFILRDALSGKEVSFYLAQDTAIKGRTAGATAADLRPGALVEVQFAPQHGNRGLARMVNILAAPGSSFTFAGKVTYLDVRDGVLAVLNDTDSKTYDIRFNPRTINVGNDLVVGAEVNVSAVFDGKGYRAESLTITRSGAEAAASEDKDKDKD